MKVYVYGEVPETTTSIIMVSGEGNKLCEEAIRLTQFTNKVIVITHRDSIYAREDLQAALLTNPFISILPFTEVTGLKYDGAGKLRAVTIRDVRHGSAVVRDIPIGAYVRPATV